MSIEIMSRVWKYADSSLGELLVLLAIADHCNDNGVSWPSVEGLAKKSRLSERQTHYIIKALQAKGYLKVELNAGPKGCNLYHVTIEGGAKTAPPGANHDMGGCTLQQKGVQSIAPESSYRIIKESSVRTDEHIEEIYQAYPKHVGKPAAMKAIARALKCVSWEYLLDRTREYARCRDGSDPQFIPHPSTWFNQERFADDPQTWTPDSKPIKKSLLDKISDEQARSAMKLVEQLERKDRENRNQM